MSYAGKKVLVTGADGFIGSHLAETLVGEGAEVSALALYSSFGTAGWLDDLADDVRDAISIARGDIRDPHFMASLLEDRDVVFHLAALIAIPHSYVAPQSYVDTNVTGTLNVLDAARRHAVGRVIHTSTSEVYGTAITTPIAESHPLQGQSPYAASKIGADMMAEAYARSFDLPVAILRPFNTYGPRQSERAVIPTVIRQALDPACTAIRVGDTTPTRDFMFVGDTASAFRALGAAAEIEFGIPYNAGTGVEVSVGDMIDIVREVSGTNKPVETDAERLRPENSEVRTLLADAGAMTAATGWQPACSLKDGLGATIEWWRERVSRDLLRPDASYLT